MANARNTRSPIAQRLAIVKGKRSEAKFARDLGVFQQNINRYMHGTPPHVDFFVTLARKEGVSADWLLLGRGSRRPRYLR